MQIQYCKIQNFFTELAAILLYFTDIGCDKSDYARKVLIYRVVLSSKKTLQELVYFLLSISFFYLDCLTLFVFSAIVCPVSTAPYKLLFIGSRAKTFRRPSCVRQYVWLIVMTTFCSYST